MRKQNLEELKMQSNKENREIISTSQQLQMETMIFTEENKDNSIVGTSGS